MPLLATHELTAFYGAFQALYGISIAVEEGETVALIGANGAGKSTLLKCIVGMLPAIPIAIEFGGQAIGGMRPERILVLGIAMAPEGRRLFPSLSLEENLRVGADFGPSRGPWSLDSIYDLFPALRARRNSPAGALSGGEQQMTAIGRALMSNPRLLLLDEVSLGLAPIVIDGLYAAMPAIKRSGTSLLIVEQDVTRALSAADRVYCLQEGRMTLAGAPATLSRDAIHAAYFGV